MFFAAIQIKALHAALEEVEIAFNRVDVTVAAGIYGLF